MLTLHRNTQVYQDERQANVLVITRCKYFNPTFFCTFMSPFSLKHVSYLTLCSIVIIDVIRKRYRKIRNLVEIFVRKSPLHLLSKCEVLVFL